MMQNGVRLGKRRLGGRWALEFEFPEKLSSEAMQEALTEWRSIVDGGLSQPYCLVWNCLSMKDYEPQARVVMQKALSRYADELDTVYLVSSSRFIRTGAMIMNLATPFRLKKLRSLSDLPPAE